MAWRNSCKMCYFKRKYYQTQIDTTVCVQCLKNPWILIKWQFSLVQKPIFSLIANGLEISLVRINKVLFSYRICTFQNILTNVKSASTTKPSCLKFTTSKSSPLRSWMILYLKRYQKYKKSKLKVQLLFSKFRRYLIGKFLDMLIRSKRS